MRSTLPAAPSTALRLTPGERTQARRAYNVLYKFKGGSGDGANPVAGFLNIKDTLYSTTSYGGGDDFGTAFAITTSGKETVLHSFFTKSRDGAMPEAGLVDVNGTLYGTTFWGGGNGCDIGCGTIYSISITGSEKVLHRFAGGSDGSTPEASLIDVKGTLYGTTQFGGANGQGTVFAITTSGAERVLYSFKGESGDGAQPVASLINVKGTLYGATEYGGANGIGSVFAITTSGKETVLYSFSGKPGDGANPVAGLTDVSGTLYGTTRSGGTSNNGTVFKITTSGSKSLLYSFKGYPHDGAYPYAGLIDVNGTLYGTTDSGGPNNDDGTAFAITTSGKETVLHSFGSSGDGANPDASLLAVNGTLYGTTSGGGAGPLGNGTVFSLKP
ncbi:MAG: choice-of-anchor tandem repeat GloVer-containing protein [Candidatus Cybelea sp.]